MSQQVVFALCESFSSLPPKDVIVAFVLKDMMVVVIIMKP